MTLIVLGALAIGISLGLLGSGGSILTIPVLISILHRPDKLAIAESLAIVGLIAISGALPYGIKRQIHWKSVIFFGLTGMVGAYLGACASYYVNGTTQITLFVCVLFAAGWMMLANPKFIEKMNNSYQSHWLMMLQGFLVGSLTGFIGVGGGFLIVPALVLFGNISIHFAIGTSLVIIAINSFTGFMRHWMNLNSLDLGVNWEVIGLISIIGMIGSFAGSFIAKKIPQMRMRQLFGICIILIGIWMLRNQF